MPFKEGLAASGGLGQQRATGTSIKQNILGAFGFVCFSPGIGGAQLRLCSH